MRRRIANTKDNPLPRALRAASAVIASASLIGCGSAEGREGALQTVHDTTDAGIPRITYPTLPDPAAVLTADLQIGALEGDGQDVFGDVRGIDVSSDGKIYILDYLASEVRVFDPSGQYESTLIRKGEGPEEILEANGLVIVGDSLLWIQDHAQWTMVALALDGAVVAREPMHVRSFAYTWRGIVDEQGVHWKQEELAETQVVPGAPIPEGLTEPAHYRTYWIGAHPSMDAVDSVPVGRGFGRALVAAEGSRMFWPVPFLPKPSTAVDPYGGFWASDGVEYRLVRFDVAGDTTLVVEVGVAPQELDRAARRQWLEEVAANNPEDRAILARLAEAIPERRPVIDALFVDEMRRVWVRREDAGGTRFDVFSQEGRFVATFRTDFPISEWLAPRVRDGRMYALSPDDLGVPFVVRAPLPGDLGH